MRRFAACLAHGVYPSFLRWSCWSGSRGNVSRVLCAAVWGCWLPQALPAQLCGSRGCGTHIVHEACTGIRRILQHFQLESQAVKQTHLLGAKFSLPTSSSPSAYTGKALWQMAHLCAGGRNIFYCKAAGTMPMARQQSS